MFRMFHAPGSKLEPVKAEFKRIYGESPPIVVRAPGRVNLIGEHTDYNEGFVLPMAIDRSMYIAARPRRDGQVHMVALDIDEQVDEFSLNDITHRPDYRWANYIRGVAYFMKQSGIELTGLDGVITSDIPSSGGLSTSAALEVATGTAFLKVDGFQLDKVSLAKLCQKAENEFLGVKSGIMDQLASALGRAVHALLIDCRDLTYQYIPLPPGISVIIADTMKKRHLEGTEYNTRRAECENATMLLSQIMGKPLRALRDVSFKEFKEAESELPPNLAQRARHVITENDRVLKAANAARRRDVVTLGHLMNESQASLRDDFQVSCEELDVMVESASNQPGCLGARLTGAGFGGATVNLVRERNAAAFVDNLAQEYKNRMGIDPIILTVRAGPGAGPV